MIIRGIDPGERIGWCDLELSDGAVNWSASGSTPAEAPADAMVRLTLHTFPDAIAIEMPGSLHPAAFAPGKGGPARIVATVQGLIRAARVGQQIIDAARAAGVGVVEVDAAQARRELGVKIGGNRKGPVCQECTGSGAGGPLTSGRACGDDIRELRLRAAMILAKDALHERGARKRRAELANIRHESARDFPCDLCGGSGEQRPPIVDQQIAALLPTLIEGWPKRSCVHSRDAAVAALWAIRRQS
jgi:hypothetical protein